MAQPPPGPAPAPASSYACPYCRIPSDGSSPTCPHCGAPTDIRQRVSRSGWVELPPIRDMARLRFGQSQCQISGAYVPVAEMYLSAQDWVWFSHHVLLHAEPRVRLAAMQMGGGWNRRLAGMPLYLMSAQGPGGIAFSENHPGEIIAVPLQHGQGVQVVEHRMLCATGNVRFSWERSRVWYTTRKGDDEEWHYPIGRYLDRFWAEYIPGLLLLHAPGSTFLRDLARGERILIQPSSLIWKDLTVTMSLRFEYPQGKHSWSKARWQAKTAWLVLAGPGRIAVSSVFRRPETVGIVNRSSGHRIHRW